MARNFNAKKDYYKCKIVIIYKEGGYRYYNIFRYLMKMARNCKYCAIWKLPNLKTPGFV